MKETARSIRRLVVIAILALGLMTVQARAYTVPQALNKARKEQISDCVWGSVLYSCVNPLLLFPVCRPTGRNEPGKPQYVCGGMFHRVKRYVGNSQICDTLYFLSPWGRVLNHSTYTCHNATPAARDRR